MQALLSNVAPRFGWCARREPVNVSGGVDSTAFQQLREHCERGSTARELVVARVELVATRWCGLKADAIALSEVDLREADLSGSEWVECRMSDVRLDRASLRGAILRLCTLEGVRASEADLREVKLENSVAAGIVLDRARLGGASLIDSDLTRASLRGADLQQVDASGADLRGADLRGADLRGAVLVDVDLRGADLTGARLEGADLDGADLRGAILDEGGEALRSEAEGPQGSAAESPPAMPPPFAELVQALAPTLVDILKRGQQRGALDEAALARIVDDVRKVGVSRFDPALSLLSQGGPLEQVLKRVNETGLTPLFAALREGGREPPPAVAQMLRSMLADAALGPGATAEDLAVYLVKQLQSSISPSDSTH